LGGKFENTTGAHAQIHVSAWAENYDYWVFSAHLARLKIPAHLVQTGLKFQPS